MYTIFGSRFKNPKNTSKNYPAVPFMRFFNLPPTHPGTNSSTTSATTLSEAKGPKSKQSSAFTGASSIGIAVDIVTRLSYFWKKPSSMKKTVVSKSNDAIYAKLLVKLTQEFGDDLLGLFAYGSRIYGNAGPHSDMDVDVLIKSPRTCRRNIVIDGLEVEIFIHPPSHICHNIKNDTTGIILRCYAFGRIIYDPQNIIPPLQHLAKIRWDQGPPPIEAKDAWQPRYEIADLLRDLEDIDYTSNESTAHFLLVKLIERLVRIQERICHRWPEKLKRCFEDWESWDPYGGHLGKTALNSNVKWSDRLCCAHELAVHVLGPIGGIMPTEWSLDWEEIPSKHEAPIIPKIEVFITS